MQYAEHVRPPPIALEVRPRNKGMTRAKISSLSAFPYLILRWRWAPVFAPFLPLLVFGLMGGGALAWCIGSRRKAHACMHACFVSTKLFFFFWPLSQGTNVIV